MEWKLWKILLYIFLNVFILPMTIVVGGDYNKIVSNVFFSDAAMSDENSGVVLIEKVSDLGLRNFVHEEGIDFSKVVGNKDRADYILLFKVIDSTFDGIVGSHLFIDEPVMRWSPIPELNVSSFIPDEGSRWIAAIHISVIQSGNGETAPIYKAKMVDRINELLPSGDSRVIEGLNGLVLLK